MKLLTTRSAVERVAVLLDGPADATPVAALAGRLRSLAADDGVAPRLEFRASLRTRLVAVATVQASVGTPGAAPVRAPGSSPRRAAAPGPRPLAAAASWTTTRRGQRGLSLAAGAMASVIVVAGVAVAGSRSLPGDPFYGLKRGEEAWELHSAGGDLARGTKHLQFAAKRLREVQELTLGRDAAFGGSSLEPLAAGALGASVSNRIRSTLADMDRETTAGSALLTSAYRTAHAEAPVRILNAFAGRQSRALEALLPALPSAARPRAELSLALVSDVGLRASQLLAVGVCTELCAPSQAAPSLPPAPARPRVPQPAPQPAVEPPCGCPAAPEQPSAPGEPVPTMAGPTPSPSSTPSPTPAPRPSTASPKPASSPTPAPLPVPAPSASLPVPVPALPVPVPTITPSGVPGPGAPGDLLPAGSGLPTGAVAGTAGGILPRP